MMRNSVVAVPENSANFTVTEKKGLAKALSTVEEKREALLLREQKLEAAERAAQQNEATADAIVNNSAALTQYII